MILLELIILYELGQERYMALKCGVFMPYVRFECHIFRLRSLTFKHLCVIWSPFAWQIWGVFFTNMGVGWFVSFFVASIDFRTVRYGASLELGCEGYAKMVYAPTIWEKNHIGCASLCQALLSLANWDPWIFHFWRHNEFFTFTYQKSKANQFRNSFGTDGRYLPPGSWFNFKLGPQHQCGNGWWSSASFWLEEVDPY